MIVSLVFVGTLLILSGILFNSFSLPETIKSISFTSENVNYEKKEAGSWKVDKSAKWIAKDQVQITFDVDTVSKSQISKYGYYISNGYFSIHDRKQIKKSKK